LVFSKVIDCLQYGHFAICFSLICGIIGLKISNRLTDGGYAVLPRASTTMPMIVSFHDLLQMS
jgi:hypothetical protein